MVAGGAEHSSLKAEMVLFFSSTCYVSVSLPQLKYFKRWIMRLSAGLGESCLLNPMTLVHQGYWTLYGKVDQLRAHLVVANIK